MVRAVCLAVFFSLVSGGGAAQTAQNAYLNGEDIAYETRMVSITVENQRNDRFSIPKVTLTGFSYVAETPQARPVLFAFNGGPGSSSIWLHVGAFGAVRIDTQAGPSEPKEITSLINNPDFLIDQTDLVFVDPYGTGLSPLGDKQTSVALSHAGNDAGAACLFASKWLEAHDRLDSPVFFMGESYGAARIAIMAGHPSCIPLRRQLKGLIFVSGVLDMSTIFPADEAGYVSAWPTAMAIRWYHSNLDKSLWDHDFDAFIAEQERFARTRIGPALSQGEWLDKAAKSALIDDVLRITGPVLLKQPDDLKHVLGRAIDTSAEEPTCSYDARYLCPKGGANGARNFHPPVSNDDLMSDFTDKLALNVSRTYGVDIYDTYEAFRRTRRWSYEESRFANMSDGKLARRLRGMVKPLVFRVSDGVAANESGSSLRTRLMIASGYHDRVTPYFGMQFALERGGFNREDFTVKTYEGGHMMYFDRAVARQLAADVRAFIRNSLVD